jgi:hypothetical protein
LASYEVKIKVVPDTRRWRYVFKIDRASGLQVVPRQDDTFVQRGHHRHYRP